MASKTVDVTEAESRFSELLSLVLEGTEIIFAQGDKPLARLTPIETASSSRVPGLHSGAIWTSDDFDEPLPIEFWLGN